MVYNPFYNIENTELLGYEYAWINFIRDNVKPDGLFPAYIVDSWVRCKEMNVDPIKSIINIERNELDGSPETAGDTIFYAPARATIKEMMKSFETYSVQLLISDARGVCISIFDKADQVREYSVDLSMSEADMGTNCVDLALREKKPVSIVGAQHYCQNYHKYACYATPVINRQGDTIASVCLRVLCEDMNDFMLAFTNLVARVIEDEMFLTEGNKRISRKNEEKNQLLNLVEDGIMYSSADNRITYSNNCFSDMIGIPVEELIGKSIDILGTVPSMLDLAPPEVEMKNLRISLRGKNGPMTCVLKKAYIPAETGDRPNVMWIFVTEQEIQLLADKVNNLNKAYFTFDDILGDSPVLKESIKLAQKVADFDTRVIIEGESGTGKEMFAQSIHNAGRHSRGPFVAIDCGAIPRELIESEMFGYEDGAFTGAKRGGAKGKFEIANNGTLFLDEIENLPLEMQSKLLRALQEKTIVRVGGTKPIPVNVQIIAATNVNLVEEIRKKNFREDLFYRLDIIHITIPPLRERKEDIPLLVGNFIERQRTKVNSIVKAINPQTLDHLIGYSWPGNVRQLNNVIERMMIMCEGNTLTEDLLPAEIVATSETDTRAFFSVDAPVPVKELETLYVKTALDANRGNIKKTAEQLQMSRATIYKYIKEGE